VPDASPEPRYTVTCRVRGCTEYGRPKLLPVGVKPLPTDHPESHYSKFHADPKDVTPRSRFNADGTRRRA